MYVLNLNTYRYREMQRWLPYEASRYKIPELKQDLGNYFYVNIRHVVPGGKFRSFLTCTLDLFLSLLIDEGQLVLTNFSDTLLAFLRRVLDHDPT
jgi:hypothetical protein